MLTESQRNTETETGGILIGYKANDSLVIVHATRPGPKAKKNRYLLILDTKYIRKELNLFETLYNFGYEGSWHKHLSMNEVYPSFIDKWLMRKVVRSSNYDVNQALLIIVNNRASDIHDISCFLFKNDSRDYRRIIPTLSKNLRIDHIS